MTNNDRDVSQLKSSLKTLNSYLEMSKAGRLEFALDIPTQIFKIFFDRSPRNNDTTLFERVCGEKIIPFHPVRYALYVVKKGEIAAMFYLSIGYRNAILPDAENEVRFDLFDLDATPIPFEEWKNQIIQVTNLINVPEELLVSTVRNIETPISPEEWQTQTERLLDSAEWKEMLLEFVQFMELLSEKVLKARGYNLDTPSASKALELPQKWQEIPQNSNIIKLSIEDFFRIIRHKYSAHADPMDNPKLQKEYDLLNAANAFSYSVNDTEITYEKLVVTIADYLVTRVNEQ